MNLKFLSWQEGKYSDLWFFVHFFSGVTGGTLLLILGVPEPAAWAVCGILAVLWEIGEWKYKIPETWSNRLLDIATAFAGGAVGYLYLRSLQLEPITNYSVFFFEAFALIALSVLGWRSYGVKK